MRIHSVLAMLTLAAVAVMGCSPEAGNEPVATPKSSPLLVPFAGEWAFDFEETLAAQKAAGVTEDQIAQLRRFYAENPVAGKMHGDLTFEGNVALGSGVLSSEYRFFGLHQHDAKVCGKAWHHEDRFDPGDMSKCFVRLEVVGERLHLEVSMQDGLPDLNDPDLVSEPPLESDASQCDVGTKAGPTPDSWATYVFRRQ